MQRKVPDHQFDIVVVGDGPVAHVTAIKLKKKGINVAIVGPRFHPFTRSGNFLSIVFEHISKSIDFNISIKQTKIVDGKPIDQVKDQIKDLERQLHTHARDLEIPIIMGKFLEFDNRYLKFIHEEKVFLIGTQIAIDCTGPARAVLKGVNKALNKDIFIINPIPGNPHTSWAFVRFTGITEKEAAQLHHKTAILNCTPSAYALTIEALRSLGWKRYNIPFFTKKYYAKKKKATMYFQIPDDAKLDEKSILQYAETLIKFATNTQAIYQLLEKSDPHKKVIGAFKTTPDQVTVADCEGNAKIPWTAHAGDATATTPFTLGTGLIRGVTRACCLVDSIFKNGSLAIHKGYQALLDEEMEKHYQEIEKHFNNPDFYFTMPIKEALALYQTAYAESSTKQNKALIKSGIERLYLEWHNEVKLNLATITLESVISGKQIRYLDITPDNRGIVVNKLDMVISDIKNTLKELSLSKEEHSEIETTLYQIAEQCTKTGDDLIAVWKSKPESAEKTEHYSCAITCYATALFATHDLVTNSTDILHVYSRLIESLYQQENYTQIIRFAEEAQKRFPLMDKKATFGLPHQYQPSHFFSTTTKPYVETICSLYQKAIAQTSASQEPAAKRPRHSTT